MKRVRVLVANRPRLMREMLMANDSGSKLPCRIVGYVPLPDQEIAVEGPVYEVDRIPNVSKATRSMMY